jgi:L-alanine-DL-glutamate epimerase-like enolase superfamily enzyme
VFVGDKRFSRLTADSYIAAPQKPGLGYEIDRDKVEDLTLQRF